MCIRDSPIALPLDAAGIQKLLPHRYPFLLVDRVLEIVPDKHILAYKNITQNEPFFTGHFPGKPIMPGVLIIEALAQAGGDATMLIHLGMRAEAGDVAFLETAGNEEEEVLYASIKKHLKSNPGFYTRTGLAIKGVTEETTTGCLLYTSSCV